MARTTHRAGRAGGAGGGGGPLERASRILGAFAPGRCSPPPPRRTRPTQYAGVQAGRRTCGDHVESSLPVV
jgi:hypothetical protein